jgi:hypothetical protein
MSSGLNLFGGICKNTLYGIMILLRIAALHHVLPSFPALLVLKGPLCLFHPGADSRPCDCGQGTRVTEVSHVQVSFPGFVHGRRGQRTS